MVANITLGLARNKGLNINVLTQSNFTKAGHYENLFFLKRSYTKMLCFLRFNSIYRALIERNKYKKTGFGRLLLYKITCNYFNSGDIEVLLPKNWYEPLTSKFSCDFEIYLFWYFEKHKIFNICSLTIFVQYLVCSSVCVQFNVLRRIFIVDQILIILDLLDLTKPL